MILFILMIMFMLFVMTKAIHELIKNNRDTNNGMTVFGSFMHSNQHMTYLIGLIIYQWINILTYSIFYASLCLRNNFTHSVLWINLVGLNLMFLMFIDHFKQEREDRIRKTFGKDLFNFK